MAQAPHFLYEKTEAQEGGYKLPKGTEQGGGGRTARPQCPHLSGEAPGLLRGRGSVCDTLSIWYTEVGAVSGAVGMEGAGRGSRHRAVGPSDGAGELSELADSQVSWFWYL